MRAVPWAVNASEIEMPPRDDVTAWALQSGLPARVVGLLYRAGVLERVDYTGQELVRLCSTPEGRARFLSPAEVRQALREPQGNGEDNVWTKQDMIAFMRTGALPACLEAGYEQFLRLEEHLRDDLARRTRIDLHTPSAPIGRPRPEPSPRSQPRARAPRQRQTGSVAGRRSRAPVRGSPSSSQSDDDPHDLNALRGFRAASERMFCHVGRRLGAARLA